MASSHQRARAKEYRRRWRSFAWAYAKRLERHYGLWLTILFAILASLLDWKLEGHEVNVGALILSVVLAALLTFGLFLLWALLASPWMISYQDEDFDAEHPVVSRSVLTPQDLQEMTVPSEGEQPSAARHHRQTIEFATGDGVEYVIPTGQKPQALIFKAPRRVIIREADLPVEIKVPRRRGRILIKQFTPRGVLIEEHRTSGVMVRFEVLYGAD